MKHSAILLFTMLPLIAEEPVAPVRPWTNVTTLSAVASDGNAKGQTFGVGEEYSYKWDLSTLVIKGGAIRVSSTVVDRTATGTSLSDYVYTEKETTTTTADNYFLNGRFDHRLKDENRWYWFTGAGWERNRPAGLDNKYAGIVGFGRIWADSDRTKVRTDLGLGYTYEQPLVVPDGFRDKYSTGNFTAQLQQKIGANTLYTVDLAYMDDLSNTKDYQGTLKQGLTVTISKRLALKAGYDIAYRAIPNLISVDVFTTAVPPVSLGKIGVPAKKTDTVFTTSLVITF